jgi:KH domain
MNMLLLPTPEAKISCPPKNDQGIPKMNTEEENRKRMYQQDDIDSALNSKRGTFMIVLFPWRETRLIFFTWGVFSGILTASLGIAHLEVENFYFKILCPQFVTGLIIGRGGSVINQLNSTCGAKIKLSQNNEFYPNTTDRILVCK